MVKNDQYLMHKSRKAAEYSNFCTLIENWRAVFLLLTLSHKAKTMWAMRLFAREHTQTTLVKNEGGIRKCQRGQPSSKVYGWSLSKR